MEEMTLDNLIQHTYHQALVEVVDLDYYRLFYGRVESIWNEVPTSLKEVEVQSINPFVAEVEQGVFEPAVQMVVTSRLVQNCTTPEPADQGGFNTVLTSQMAAGSR